MVKLQSPDDIKRIIIHCAATPPTMDIGVKEIRRWHAERGWYDIGYHFVIRRDGGIERGIPIHQVGSHTAGKNTGSIGICMVGGINKQGKPESNFTPEQWDSLEWKVDELINLLPRKVSIHGHNEFSAKACPSFDVQEWVRDRSKRGDN